MELILPRVAQSYRASGREVFHLEIPQLTLRKQELTYLIGHNGSGKSLFAETISGSSVGALRPRPRTVESRSGRSTTVRLIRQRPEENICLDLSVGENLVLWASSPTSTLRDLLATPRAAAGAVAERLLARSGFRWGVDTRRLSTGERQILAFECARLRQADLYILDEFTSGLDPAAKAEILPEVKNLVSTVLLISHDVDEVCDNAARVLVFARGRLVADHSRPVSGWSRQTLREYASGT